ncbi:mandelate racemase/muconate lactonizing enzyme family protein [Ammoniphilus sp. 3BR4]|uniref:mandelate racemase/muconate lactonizing enzyme family protein n=1 Tax=Ammoniphilus sp. 3BR4 TaxID=3158265 RepID=UPI003466ACA4
MKIVDYQSGLYRVPLTENWGSSNYAFSSLEFVIVWLKTDTGLTGTGWTFSVGVGGSALKNLIDHYLVQKVLGEDPFQYERLWNKMWLESHDIGSTGVTTHAIAALDIAIWDILGQSLKQPLYRLFGGYRESLSGYGSGVNLHLNKDELLGQMESFMSQGYRSIKMKIGKEDPYEDLDRLLAVRELVGRTVNIMVDANQKWYPADAIRRMDILKPADLYWFEEPVLSDDIKGHTYVRQKCQTPIAIGESLYTKYHFAQFINQGACDFVQPDIYRVGGITEFMKIVKLAEGNNVPVAPHFGMELIAHLGCASPNILFFEGLRGAGLSEMGIIENPVQVLNGEIKPSSHPGHGIRFDEGMLKKYEQHEQDLRNQNIRTRIDIT